MIPDTIREEDFMYQLPPEKETRDFLKKFDDYLSIFCQKVGIEKSTIFFNPPLLIDIHTRIDQRHDYYRYYHSEDGKVTHMSQAKEMALLCYWVTKYKPLFQEKAAMEEYYSQNFCTINEMFALFMIKSFVLGVANGKEAERLSFFSTDNNYVMLYNFMHRDMSKESFILYVTSLLDALEV
ncbi:MAG: hypothetical protein LBH09_06635 [Peptococcaceae bacterium]|nr:hypothetical protein [Peptococcaceae bacterium]